MAVTDFAQLADPWLGQLQDNPSCPLPQNLDSTTFPLGGDELDGHVIDMDRESDGEGDVLAVDAGHTPSDENIDAGRTVSKPNA